MKNISPLRLFICVVVVIASFLFGWYIVPVDACEFTYPRWYFAYETNEVMPKVDGIRKGVLLTDAEINLIMNGNEAPAEYHQKLARAMMYKSAYATE